MSSQNFTRACEVITERHRSGVFTSLECFLCGSQVTGYRTLERHIYDAHGVKLPPFDDVELVDEMLAELGSKCRLSSAIICPATQLTFNSLESFEKAVKATDRADDLGRWTWDTIPSLGRYRVICVDTEDADEDTDDQVAYEDLGDNTDGCFIDKIECPYCCLGLSSNCFLFSSSLFNHHMMSSHGIHSFVTLLNAFRKEDGAKLCTHDKVRLINMIRKATDNNRIPQSGESVSECRSEMIFEKLKEQHKAAMLNGTLSLSPYLISAGSFSNLTVLDNEDKYLIPKRPNDPLITFCMQGDNTDDEWSDDDAEEYPMVPTLGETLAKRYRGTHQQRD